jgi:ATP-dependent DNA helicase RecG
MRDYSETSDDVRRRASLDALITRLRSPILKSDNRPPRIELRPLSDAVTDSATPFPRTQPEARAGTSYAGDATAKAAAGDVANVPTTRAVQPPATREPRSVPPFEPRRAERQPVPPAPKARASLPRRSESGLGLDAPVTKISGIGDFNAQKFARLGVNTIRDLLHYFPTRYDDYSALKTINQLFYGQQVTIIGRVAAARRHRTKSNLWIVRVAIEDASGTIECSWFTNERFVDSMLKQFAVGREIVISGKVGEYLGKLTFQNPTYEPAEREWITGGNIVPVYRLTEGLQPLLVRRVMKRLIEYWPMRVPEHLPESVRRGANLISLADALRDIHFPHDMRAQENARRRLAFDELFTLQLSVLQQRQAWRKEPARELQPVPGVLDALIGALPYALTSAQRRAVDAVANDIGQSIAMHRLLQGDVGSGKTVVAALGMALATSAGAQAALMAPTEILAEQHFKSISALFDAFNARAGQPPIRAALLTGSVKASDKRAVHEALADGSVQVVIGTHALIQEGVTFARLGFVVVDEQHRFGVVQRTALRQKAGDLNPHTLVMTATPIPRTLALTLYGDLDNTVLDEMPPGRQSIETLWIGPTERERAYRFVQHQVSQGHQAFIICPLVEESDKVEARAATEEYERLKRDVFPELRLGLLHGKLRPADKDEAMLAFARGETDILVSTSVVEVGIDVPNATVIVIEGANRFGLAQLHQFRGRVGRGEHKSHCLLFADSSSDVGDQRLQAIVNTTDGFKLAEIDLELRGPGEFFGTRQSGDPELKLVNVRDRDLLDVARREAAAVLEADPELAQHPLLAERAAAFWRNRETGDAS